jgi:hypothetical protein
VTGDSKWIHEDHYYVKDDLRFAVNGADMLNDIPISPPVGGTIIPIDVLTAIAP